MHADANAHPIPALSLQIKCYLRQLFSGLALLQTADVLHRDLKNANLLVNNKVGGRTQWGSVTGSKAGPGDMRERG